MWEFKSENTTVRCMSLYDWGDYVEMENAMTHWE